jgi:cysteine synthase
MKKLLSTGMALAMCATICGGTVDAYTATADSLNQASTVSVAQSRQASYLDALRLRYKNMYNRMRHNRDYYNSFVQDERIEEVKKDNHIEGNLGSDMNREGEMEQDKDRVRTVNRNRVQAVNAKQTFRKAAIDYYVDGGDGYTNSDAMEMGNVDGMTNEVSRRKMVNEMYKIDVGTTVLTTRDMIRNLGVRMGNKSVLKPSTYYKGGFNDRMISPYMSTDWLEE